MIWLQICGGESFSVPTIHQGSEYRVVSDSTQLRTCRHPHTQTGGSAATVTKHSYLVKFHTILHSIIDSHKTFLLGQISHYTAQYYRQSQNIPTWSNFTLYCTILSTKNSTQRRLKQTWCFMSTETKKLITDLKKGREGENMNHWMNHSVIHVFPFSPTCKNQRDHQPLPQQC